ncbi:MAG: hypothetical protein U9R75_01715 [Candidatus Thermoplasmatota archaeon]|nr:hypothetical protein [Candidatus Thermoplasmatota archaeon]
MNEQQTILRSVDRILGIDYYITGYASACQNGIPIDVDEKCILIMVKKQNTRKERMLDAIKESTEYVLRWQATNNIPKDVQRRNISGAEVWISSMERGMVDSIKTEECGKYPIFLLLVQNAVNRSVDLQNLMEYAKEQEIENIFGSALSIISDRLSNFDDIYGFHGPHDKDVIRSVDMALNTVLG